MLCVLQRQLRPLCDVIEISIVWECARLRSIVAIPARNEAERIEECLRSLDRQSRRPDRVVLLVNNSTDETASLARSLAREVRFSLETIDCELPLDLSNAGNARRLALNTAAADAFDNDALLTTDADTIVPPNWIEANLAVLVAGADAVCGRAILDPRDAYAIPEHLQADDRLERHLIYLLDALAWELDPELHDAPPRHVEASGASLAVTARAYRRVGGIPAMASGEDRAFVRALWKMDAAIRHDPSICVIVSGRIDGRADGGMAGTIRRRLIRQDEFTDQDVEPARCAVRRYSLRHLVRRAWVTGDPGPLLSTLALPAPVISGALLLPYFGAAWAALEDLIPVLSRQRVRFQDLPVEIINAEQSLRQVIAHNALAAD
jgi:GT2 family glycosyltransferase